MRNTPTIADARELGKRYGLLGVVILHHDGVKAGYASWGRTKYECGWMKRCADRCFDALMAFWSDSR